MRPSVETEDGMTNSDDLTNKLNDIVKTNHVLSELLNEKPNTVVPINKTGVCRTVDNKILEQWCLLQYHVATYIDNEISNIKPATSSRSSRPLKTLRQRIKSKKGRIRRNLMGKRVNYSARSVITPDANISIDQLGVPKKIAMTLSWPEMVTEYNIEFLTKLVRNGPYKYPGANYIKEKMLTTDGQVKQQMRQIKYIDYEKKNLSYGSVVYRHLMDDDAIFFNRQPTLHKMSMMTHRAKILMEGDTFRLNTQVTTPYNADFDGDEMNCHLPRSIQTKVELQLLTSVPTQIVSPQASKPVMGMVQDGLLGSYRFTSSVARFNVVLESLWKKYYEFGMETINNELSVDDRQTQLLIEYKDSPKEVEFVWIDPDFKKTVEAVKKLPETSVLREYLMKQIEVSRDKETYTTFQRWVLMGFYSGLIMTEVSNIGEIPDFVPEPDTNPDSPEADCLELKPPQKDDLNEFKKAYIADGFIFPNTYLLMSQKFNQVEMTHALQCTTKYSGILPEPDFFGENDEPYWTAQTMVSYIMPQLTYKKASVNMINGDLSKNSVLDSQTVGKGANSLIHVIWNDFGPERTRNFFDDLAYLANNWLLKGGFSVGYKDINVPRELSELNRKTLREQIIDVDQEYIDKVHQGLYQKKSRDTVRAQFEMDINIALNKVRSHLENQTYNEIPPWNRIHNMITSGSKGKKNNLVQIMTLLGQQDLEGSRIPDYFYRRTLPHFAKDSIEPEAKGFIIDSFLVGLNPTNYWFHAQSGRIGVISTSIKTAETGYIQRKLVKIMEDAQIMVDGTVRNSLNLILSFCYGNDGFDACRLESVKINPIITPKKSTPNGVISSENMVNYYFSSFQLFAMKFKWTSDDLSNLESFLFPGSFNMDEIDADILSKEYEELTKCRDYLRLEMHPDKVPEHMMLPINFSRMITNIRERLPSSLPVSNINPSRAALEVNRLIEQYVKDVSHFPLVKKYATRDMIASIRANLNSKYLVSLKISQEQFKTIIEQTYQKIIEAYVNPGEMVGAIAAQSIGEPTTQLTLNVFHSTGQGSAANVSRGVPRMKEIMDLTKNPKTPSYNITLADWKMYKNVPLIGARESENKELYEEQVSQIKKNVKEVMSKLTYTTLKDLSDSVKVIGYTFGTDLDSLRDADKFIVQQYLDTNPEVLQEYELQKDNEEGISSTVWIIHFNLKSNAMLRLKEFEGRPEIIYLSLNIAEKAIREGGPGKKKWSDLRLDYNLSTTFDSDNIFVQAIVLNMGEEGNIDPVATIRGLTKKLENSQIMGIEGIEQAYCRQVKKIINSKDGALITPEADEYSKWKSSRDYGMTIDTNNNQITGQSMYQLFAMNDLDYTKVYSNNIQEVMSVLGIEAAKELIFLEATEVLEFAGTHINHRHMELLSDVMTVQGYLVPVSRYGVNKSDSGPWARASFEETAQQVSTAAFFSEKDPMTGVTPNIMFGQFIKAGTNSMEVMMDENILEDVEPPKQEQVEKPPQMKVEQQRIAPVRDEYCNRDNFQFMFAICC
jgi:DNA-directed RNA polymerase beta' subunit